MLIEGRIEKPMWRRYHRCTSEQKQALLDESREPGMSISLIARKYGVPASTLFLWRTPMEKGAQAGLETKDDLVPSSQVKALQGKIRELERLLGKKTVEVEILKQAVELSREKKLISRAQLRGVEGFK